MSTFVFDIVDAIRGLRRDRAYAATVIVTLALFEVRARDPLVVTAVVALVAIAGLLASIVAARQGLSIDPAAALRDE